MKHHTTLTAFITQVDAIQMYVLNFGNATKTYLLTNIEINLYISLSHNAMKCCRPSQILKNYSSVASSLLTVSCDFH